MPYLSNGSLITESREVDESTTWNTQSGWGGNQDSNAILVENGTVKLMNIPELTVDNFDDSIYGPDGDLGDLYSGDLSAFSRDPSIVESGGHSAFGSGADNVMITSTNQIFTDPFTIRVWLYGDSTSNFGFAFASQSATGAEHYSGYTSRVRHDNNLLDISQWDNGPGFRLGDVDLTPPNSEWYYMEVSISSGSVSSAIYESDGTQIGSTVSVTSDTYTSGGHGLLISSGQGRFDTITDES